MTKLIDDAIRYATYVHAPPEAVYDAIATGAGLDGWFTRGAFVDARAGGQILFRWHRFGAERVSGETRGPVLEAQRPRRFVFRWHPSADDSWMTTVTIDIEQTGDGATIHLTENGYPDSAAGLRAMLNCAAGWGEALTLWKFYVEHNIAYDDRSAA